MTIQPISGDDILLWPCGDWCLRCEHEEHVEHGDDFETIPFGTPRWDIVQEA